MDLDDDNDDDVDGGDGHISVDTSSCASLHVPYAHRTFHRLTNLLAEHNLLSAISDILHHLFGTRYLQKLSIVTLLLLSNLGKNYTFHFSIRLAHTTDRSPPGSSDPTDLWLWKLSPPSPPLSIVCAYITNLVAADRLMELPGSGRTRDPNLINSAEYLIIKPTDRNRPNGRDKQRGWTQSILYLISYVLGCTCTSLLGLLR